MPAPIAKTKAQDVIEQISALNGDRTRVDQFTIARLKRAARESMTADPVAAHMALGALASFEWDDAALDLHHQTAIRLQDNEVTRMNYATSLAGVQRPREAWVETLRASQTAPTDLNLLGAAIRAAYIAGEFTEARRLCEDYAKRSPTRVFRGADRIVKISEVLERRDFSIATTTKMVDIAFGLLKEERIENQAFQIRTYDEPSDSSVMYFIFVRKSRKEIRELEEKLADRMFDEVEALDFSAFWIGYEEESGIDLETFGAD